MGWIWKRLVWLSTAGQGLSKFTPLRTSLYPTAVIFPLKRQASLCTLPHDRPSFKPLEPESHSRVWRGAWNESKTGEILVTWLKNLQTSLINELAYLFSYTLSFWKQIHKSKYTYSLDFLGRPVVNTPFSLQGARSRSLVWEPRSHTPHGAAKRLKKQKTNKTYSWGKKADQILSA